MRGEIVAVLVVSVEQQPGGYIQSTNPEVQCLLFKQSSFINQQNTFKCDQLASRFKHLQTTNLLKLLLSIAVVACSVCLPKPPYEQTETLMI